MTVYGGLFRGTAPEEKAAVLASYGEKKNQNIGRLFYFVPFAGEHELERRWKVFSLPFFLRPRSFAEVHLTPKERNRPEPLHFQQKKSVVSPLLVFGKGP